MKTKFTKQMREAIREVTAMGGRAKADKMTAKDRKELGRFLADARKAKREAKAGRNG